MTRRGVKPKYRLATEDAMEPGTFALWRLDDLPASPTRGRRRYGEPTLERCRAVLLANLDRWAETADSRERGLIPDWCAECGVPVPARLKERHDA